MSENFTRYAVGMYGGSFNPIHMGHVRCILQAANMCEQLFLVLSCGNHREEIDVRVRYRWLYQLTAHIGNVTILQLSDDADTKADYTSEYWMADAMKVRAGMGEKLGIDAAQVHVDVVFCGSDYDEKSFWNVCYPEAKLHIFQRDGISSTELRKDIYGHWDWIPRVARPYFVKKVLLIGGESAGKSTLTINLAETFNTTYQEEAGRDLSEKSGTDLMMLPEDFTEILLTHKLQEMKALERADRVLFVDTDALVTEFYMHFLEDPQIERNAALADAIDRINSYDLILFLEPDAPFINDGDRSPVIEADREKYSNQIKDLLKSHGRDFVCLQGSYQERYEAAVELVNKLLEPA